MDCTRCQKLPQLLESFCEPCYIKMFVTPLVKERENSEQIIHQLTEQIQSRFVLINQAKRVTDNRMTSNEASRRMAERRRMVQQGDIKATAFIYCRKCYAPFESGVECLVHEEECIILPRSKRHGQLTIGATTMKTGRRKPAQQIELSDSLEDI